MLDYHLELGQIFSVVYIFPNFCFRSTQQNICFIIYCLIFLAKTTSIENSTLFGCMKNGAYKWIWRNKRKDTLIQTDEKMTFSISGCLALSMIFCLALVVQSNPTGGGG